MFTANTAQTFPTVFCRFHVMNYVAGLSGIRQNCWTLKTWITSKRACEKVEQELPECFWFFVTLGYQGNV